MEKVVPIEESLSLKEAKLSFSNLQTLGGPERRTFRFSEEGRVERLGILA